MSKETYHIALICQKRPTTHTHGRWRLHPSKKRPTQKRPNAHRKETYYTQKRPATTHTWPLDPAPQQCPAPRLCVCIYVCICKCMFVYIHVYVMSMGTGMYYIPIHNIPYTIYQIFSISILYISIEYMLYIDI